MFYVLKSLKDPRMVIWFDIDNTLYSASTKISHTMGERIHGMFAQNRWIVSLKTSSVAYFVSLGLDKDEASELHHRYYTQYGLALRGLTRHHDIGNYIKWLLSNYDDGLPATQTLLILMRNVMALSPWKTVSNQTQS